MFVIISKEGKNYRSDYRFACKEICASEGVHFHTRLKALYNIAWGSAPSN